MPISDTKGWKQTYPTPGVKTNNSLAWETGCLEITKHQYIT